MTNEVLTNAQIEEKRAEIEKQLGVKIHALNFMVNEGTEQVIGFMKEPPRLVKLRVLDKSVSSPMTAASECLEAVLVREHSDSRILSELPEHDEIYLGACVAASAAITYSANQFKKK